MEVKIISECNANGENPEYLFWVGSAGSFDVRSKKITRAFVSILNKANIDFAVLGKEESSSGDVAKRAGNEFLFQMQALMNIEILNNYNVKKIITTCPHSYNVLKNEYKTLGGDYHVYHHTEFLLKIINSGKLKLNKDISNKKVTYHDPCYLGRGNSIYDEPRKLIRFLGINLVEMKRSKRKSFCCGAGGAQMFKEPEKGSKDINIERTEEAISCNIDAIITACPFCNTMMSDGVKLLKDGEIDVLDIVELINESV
ncbi:MAG: CoB--CoM heterodisulfide reductase [Flavobacteriales bacterium]|nr:CoB--CoM heterodisulfide reductase [Flavobacteriales bacterium]|tara:strand:+ start:219 stop:986 length:768 start_codon:yes stop_codon:yes gene_type:complete